MTVKVVSDDGMIRVEEVRDAKGVVIGTNVVDVVASAGAAVLEGRRDVLRAQLDPNSADPTPKALADAQAFVALAADIGIVETAAVAGLDIAVEEKA